MQLPLQVLSTSCVWLLKHFLSPETWGSLPLFSIIFSFLSSFHPFIFFIFSCFIFSFFHHFFIFPFFPFFSFFSFFHFFHFFHFFIFSCNFSAFFIFFHFSLLPLPPSRAPPSPLPLGPLSRPLFPETSLFATMLVTGLRLRGRETRAWFVLLLTVFDDVTT